MTYYSPSYIFQLVLLRVNYHVSTWLTPDRRAQETPYELIKHMLAFFLTTRTPLDFGMIIARNPSSHSAPRTMIGVEGRESLPNSPTMGSRPERSVYSICIHRGPYRIENTIWRAQVYPKAIRTRSHEFTLIHFRIYVVYRIYYFEHDSALFGTGSGLYVVLSCDVVHHLSLFNQ